ncbi:MAG: YncE family protein [Myxococcota bacterium]
MRRPVHSLSQIFSFSRLLVAAALPTLGCYSAGDGVSPPEDRIYFPVGLALVNDARHLVVANSDFDLQYNAGTLNVLDVTQLAPFVGAPCASDSDCQAAATRCDEDSHNAYCSARTICHESGLCVDPSKSDPNRSDGQSLCGLLAPRRLTEQLLSPGACAHVDPSHPPETATSLLLSEVQIGAFATDVVFRERPAALPAEDASGRPISGRAFIPVRGDATLHWADVSVDGRLECGQLNGGSCDDLHRAGNHPEENTRDLRMASEPFAVAASPGGEALMVTNQTSGTVSLFVNNWDPQVGPALEFAVTGLPARPVGIAALPTPGYVAVRGDYYPPGFLVTFRNAPEIDLLRYYDDSNRSPGAGDPVVRPYAARTGVSTINVNSVGSDSRGIAIDSSARRRAEQACSANGDASLDCLLNASTTPLDVFVANRSPATLLLGRTAPARNALENTEAPNFYDSLPLTLGPSRVVVGNVVVGVDDSGASILERRVFVVCFDSRRIFVYDPDRRRLDAEISTGRGPHALAVDEKRGWLFVGHFTDSFISVVSLNRRFPKTYGTTLAIIGKPTPPRASK